MIVVGIVVHIIVSKPAVLSAVLM